MLAGAQDLIATASNLMHPHDVHDVQTDAGKDPCAAAAERHPIEGLRAVYSVHTAVVNRHDRDSHHEEHDRHEHAVGNVESGGFRVT